MKRKRIMTWLIVILACYAVWVAGAMVMQRRVLFPRHFTGAASDGKHGQEVHWIESDAARVEMWFFPGQGVDAEHPGPAVIFAHGNAELIHNCVWSDVPNYVRLGVSVALIEYRGYGNSTGSPSQSGITADYVAGYDLIAGRADVDARRIFVHGRSLGGGVVSSLARHRKPAAIVLQSTFTSVTSMAGRLGIPPFAVRDPFDSLAVLKAYAGPVLILHGEHDTIIPADHGRRLAAAAPHAQLALFESNHNDFPLESPGYRQVLERFLGRCGLIGTSARGEEGSAD